MKPSRQISLVAFYVLVLASLAMFPIVNAALDTKDPAGTQKQSYAEISVPLNIVGTAALTPRDQPVQMTLDTLPTAESLEQIEPAAGDFDSFFSNGFSNNAPAALADDPVSDTQKSDQ